MEGSLARGEGGLTEQRVPQKPETNIVFLFGLENQRPEKNKTIIVFFRCLYIEGVYGAIYSLDIAYI